MRDAFIKIKPLVFNINKVKPQTLFVGNGISRCCGFSSWDDILDSIKDIDDKSTADLPDIPFPLKFNALIRLGNENLKRKQLCLEILKTDIQESAIIAQLLSLPNTQILTTNYSYELEESVVPGFSKIKTRQKKHIYETEYDNRYLLHTFNKIHYKGVDKDIWHIHGEARRQSSLILNHDSYARLTHKAIEQSHKVKDSFLRHRLNDEPIYFDSWFDYFMLGDIYIIGQGFDFSEFVLWWLLNRKANEKANEGKVYFYELPNAEPNQYDKHNTQKDTIEFYSEYVKQQEKYMLLRSFGVVVIDLSMKKYPNCNISIFEEFYRKALTDIEMKMKAAIQE